MELRSVPKVVLHDHLDGGLRPETVLELAADVGYTDLPASDPAALEAWFDQGNSGSLVRYLEAFTHTTAVMQTAEAIERVAYESLVDVAADGVIHLESRFAPSLFTVGGLTRQQALEAAASGFRRAARRVDATWAIIVDAMRQDADSTAVAEAALAAGEFGVVGFDLAGPEAGHPAANHREACELVLDAGLGLTIHAGEAAGPDSIADALDCGAQRIGHGYRIVEDCRVEDGEITHLGPVAARVHDRHIPLEICPFSNTHTAGIGIDDHPVGILRRAGFVVTISPDNRLMSRTSATREFQALADHHGWGRPEVEAAVDAAVDATFLSEERRRHLRGRLSDIRRSLD